MAEEMSPESKLYVKEEIEQIRKEFKEDLKEVQSKATRTFTTVALIVGLLTGLGVYLGLDYTISKALDETSIKELTAKIEGYEKEANASFTRLKNFENNLSENRAEINGCAWVGDIKFVWGTEKSTIDTGQTFQFKHGGFDNACFTVITNLPGDVFGEGKTKFTFDRMNDYGGSRPFTFVAIGH